MMMMTLSIARGAGVGLTRRSVTWLLRVTWLLLVAWLLLVVDRYLAVLALAPVRLWLRTSDDNSLALEGTRLLLGNDNSATAAHAHAATLHHHCPLLHSLAFHHAEDHEKDAASKETETPPAEVHPEDIAASVFGVVVAIGAPVVVVVVVGVKAVSHLFV